MYILQIKIEEGVGATKKYVAHFAYI